MRGVGDLSVSQFFSRNPTLEECQSYFCNAEDIHASLCYASLLHLAAESYRGTEAISIIKWLLGPPHFIPIESSSRLDNSTALMMAVYNGNFVMACALIACGAGVNTRVEIRLVKYYHGQYRGMKSKQWTALDYILHAHAEVPAVPEKVLFLLDNGAKAGLEHAIPDYGKRFLKRRKQLSQACFIVLGMRFRARPYLDRWLLLIIARLVWKLRFTDDDDA
jgi:hypothetical protein